MATAENIDVAIAKMDVKRMLESLGPLLKGLHLKAVSRGGVTGLRLVGEGDAAVLRTLHLLPGDIVTEFNGAAITNPQKLALIYNGYKALRSTLDPDGEVAGTVIARVFDNIGIVDPRLERTLNESIARIKNGPCVSILVKRGSNNLLITYSIT